MMAPEVPTCNIFFALHEAIAVKGKNDPNAKTVHA